MTLRYIRGLAEYAREKSEKRTWTVLYGRLVDKDKGKKIPMSGQSHSPNTQPPNTTKERESLYIQWSYAQTITRVAHHVPLRQTTPPLPILTSSPFTVTHINSAHKNQEYSCRLLHSLSEISATIIL